ncbi:MAG TPA: hypothetical protein VNJ07_14275, partial [Chitinophagales bacterium]|nr:hypothetical protein [Chitinophagales bacterium]
AYTSAGSFYREPGEYMFDPTWQNFHYDDYLADASSRGMKVVLCLSKNFTFYADSTGTNTQSETHPVAPGANKEDPASYILYGKLAFQIAARYGSRVVPDSLLKVKSFPAGNWQHQDKLTETGWLYGIEIWNEADKWGGDFTAPEYFALLSACYDGHKGTLGNDVGVMQADPDMKFLFTGTTDNTTNFTKAVRDIWVQQRGEPFPENIIFNFHVYFHNKYLNNGNRTTGIAPELGGALDVYRKWAFFSGSNSMAKTEYGWDTHPNSIQKAPLLSRPDTGDYSREESQAALLLRSYHLQTVFPQMLISTFYQVRDENPGNSFQYSTCGVTYGGSAYAPKESYFIVSGFIQLADGFYSSGTLMREDPYVVRYSDGQGKYLYAVWTYAKNKFTIPAITTADDTVMLLVSTKTGIDSTVIIPQNGSFSMDAQQMPVYLVSDGLLSFHVPACEPLTVQNITLPLGDSLLINGAYRKSTGTYYDTLVTLSGSECDSIIVTNLTVPGSIVTISGSIATEMGTPVPGVQVHLSGFDTVSFVTSPDGIYSFNVNLNESYVVAPFKNNDSIPHAGITTFDLVLMQRHILQIAPLSTPYKVIAADVNGSGTITTLDIVLTRALILNNATAFPNGRLWEFVSSGFIFPDPQHPFPFERTISCNNILQPLTQRNFIAIKLGDVNNSWDSGVH